MPLAATRLQIHNAIVARIAGIFTTRPVHARVRRPREENEKQIQGLFNDSNGILNYIVVRYVGLTRQASSFDDTISLDHYFEIEIRRAINDTEDDAAASETLFNADLDALNTAFTDYDFGLDAGVSSKGIEIRRLIERDPQPFYGKGCHVAYPQLVVTVAEC
jgi:hypothetical protein